MKVHLIDGTFELFRAFYGAPKRQVQGVEVGATRGLVRSLLALLKEPDVTHVACAFDHVIESFRTSSLPATRPQRGSSPSFGHSFRWPSARPVRSVW